MAEGLPARPHPQMEGDYFFTDLHKHRLASHWLNSGPMLISEPIMVATESQTLICQACVTCLSLAPIGRASLTNENGGFSIVKLILH